MKNKQMTLEESIKWLLDYMDITVENVEDYPYYINFNDDEMTNLHWNNRQLMEYAEEQRNLWETDHN